MTPRTEESRRPGRRARDEGRGGAGRRRPRRVRRLAAILTLVLLPSLPAAAQDTSSYVSRTGDHGTFALSADGRSAPLCVSSGDFPGVRRVAGHLRTDIALVTGAGPAVLLDSLPRSGESVLIGTLGRSPAIDALVREGKLDTAGIAGRRETFVIQVVARPLPGVDRALVIAGSDKRGTIFGMYDLSSQIGVSPWYWWADVPPKKSAELYVLPGRYSRGEPKVRYRGIFINDEAPALSGWVEKKFGGFNARFYDHVFELILRLRGNFLWPAMWGRAFYDDDPENPRLADEYGVVIGTSHHEPMMRAHDEWRRYGGGGAWNYEKNDSALREFWRAGIRRMGPYESVVTLAMRGDGDEPMSDEANTALLRRIVDDQRRIIREVTGADVTRTPQVWALYKEVQEYYDRGMRVPDDVTLLLCDDNWGNIRKLPGPTDPPHPGGYGMYYHFDFVGGPRSYKWLNTVQIERVWEQMRLAYASGVDRIWIVNVGDIKPMEFPINFFLDLAWDPEAVRAEDLPRYYRGWAAAQFGPEHAGEIADILMRTTKFNSRRKPEMLGPDTYSLTNCREAETVAAEYDALAAKARGIYGSLAPEYRDAFYQLVLHQPEACATLNDMYVAAALNRLYATQGRAAANGLARRVRELYARDSAITRYYNTVMANGKWDHMMDQTHIGYTSWQQPDANAMPPVEEIAIPETSEMGVAPEGAAEWWPEENGEASLPEFDSFNTQTYYIEVFNRGTTPFHYAAQPQVPWIRLEPGIYGSSQVRLNVSVDWESAPPGRTRSGIVITGPGESAVTVYAPVNNAAGSDTGGPAGFVESNGCVSIEAAQYDSALGCPGAEWVTVPNLGRTGSAVTIDPGGANALRVCAGGARLAYRVRLSTAGEATVRAYVSPVMDCFGGGGVRYAVSFDNGPERVVNITEADTVPDWKYPQWWNQAVSDNIRIASSRHTISAGIHTLMFRAVDPGIVLQKIVIETGPVKPSYLGPPESIRR